MSIGEHLHDLAPEPSIPHARLLTQTQSHRTALETLPAFILALAATCMTLGILWDISWHISIGRDTFWTPAHMAIYFGGSLGGFAAGWLALYYTFLARPEEREASVGIFGARAPLGAWVVMWGAVAMLTSAPFDNWWHNAYGLDVKIISLPHTLLGLGMLGIVLGALILGLSRQNRAPDHSGDAVFIYISGIFVTLGSVFVMEMTTPNLQHAAVFYKAVAAAFAFRIVAIGVAGRMSWPATRASAVFLLFQCLVTWILPLFPAQPKLAPINNPITHMVPPAFPVLIIFPALAVDLILRRTGEGHGWKQRLALAVALGAAFFAVLLGVQWFLSEFLLSPHANNWFFAGGRYFGYAFRHGPWSTRFWHDGNDPYMQDPINAKAALTVLAIASVGSWIGLYWGSWMKKVRR
ncbi:MAG TPA: hypothetical protein VGH90_01830 [Chthoniobacteraceae bacterium]|jgi:hypothetical protein